MNMINHMEKIKNGCYHYKSNKNHANILHQFYSIDDFHVPTINEIVIGIIRIHKWFQVDFIQFEYTQDEYDEDDKRFKDEWLPICDFLGIDYDSIQEKDAKHWFENLESH